VGKIEDQGKAYAELKEQVAHYISKEVQVDVVKGVAFPCCNLPQSYPGKKDNFTGDMTCKNCGKVWVLTRKAGVLRVQSK
jgi:hypothetical protein